MYANNNVHLLELASEIKEHFPEKHVTLIHSRSRYMAKYKESVDRMTYNVLRKHGVRQILGDRVILPENGFPLKVEPLQIRTKNGKVIDGDLAVSAVNYQERPMYIEPCLRMNIDYVHWHDSQQPAVIRFLVRIDQQA